MNIARRLDPTAKQCLHALVVRIAERLLDRKDDALIGRRIGEFRKRLRIARARALEGVRGKIILDLLLRGIFNDHFILERRCIPQLRLPLSLHTRNRLGRMRIVFGMDNAQMRAPMGAFGQRMERNRLIVRF